MRLAFSSSKCKTKTIEHTYRKISSTDCREVYSPHAETEAYEPYDSRNAVSQNFMLENCVTSDDHSFADPEDAKQRVVQNMEMIGGDNAGDHEDQDKTSCDDARGKIKKEAAIPPNILLENATILVGYSDFAPADHVEVNQTTELNAGNDEKDKIEKCDMAGNECKEVADLEAHKNHLSESVAVVENGTDNESARNLGDSTQPKHYTRSVSEIEVVVEDSTNDSIRNLGQNEHNHRCNFPSEIEVVAGEDGREEFIGNLGETELIHYEAEKEPIHYKNTTCEIGVVVVDHGMNGSPRKLRQIESNQYQSSAAEIEVAVEDGTDNSERIQPAKIGSKPLENVVGTNSTKNLPQNKNFQEGIKEVDFDNCEIQEECSCADESGVVAQLSRSGDVELSQNLSPKPTLEELLRFAAEEESSAQNTAVVMNTRDFDSWDLWGNSYKSSGYEGLYSQKKGTAVEQYHGDMLDDYERRTCTPLFQVKDRSNNIVNKPQWRKAIDGILGKFRSLRKRQPNPLGGILDEVDLKSLLKAANSKRCKRENISSIIMRKTFWGRLACCSSASTGSAIRSHKRKKPKEWQLQLQRYVSEYSPAW
ncbi:uncharacterized protein LOC122315516 isoform X3 [Carya illinoinensis]|uniref:Uncharacterized protein n=3 Tax=Carya illinoinensis TaxID=32201 RepID=A0A8T1RLA4_CARIL|nr:uncharacterized protein LOC122315516 isoform X3 [Carya illinoinensis]KAG6667616.1 hypothetical protein CIPAW_01G113400 [Carya illinoinensis]